MSIWCPQFPKFICSLVCFSTLLIYFLYQNIPALLKNSLNDAEPRMLYRKTTVSMIFVALKDAVISPPLVFVHYWQRGPNCIKSLINSNYKSVR